MKYNRWADFHVHADVIKKPEPSGEQNRFNGNW
jgi:hypothetical protein